MATGDTAAGETASDSKSTTTTPLESFLAALGKLPESETKPASGSVSVDADAHGQLENLIAYSLLDDVVGPVVDSVVDLKARAVLVVEDRAFLHSCWSHTAVDAQLAALEGVLTEAEAMLEAHLSPPNLEVVEGTGPSGEVDRGERAIAGPALLAGAAASLTALLPGATAAVGILGAAPALMGAAMDVVGMFRTSYSYAGRVMTPSGTPLVAETVRTLRRRGVDTFVDGFTVGAPSPLLERLAACRTRAARLLSDAVGLRSRVTTGRAAIVRLEAELGELRAAVVDLAKKGEVSDVLDSRTREVSVHLAESDAANAADAAALAVVDGALTAANTVAALMASPDGTLPPLVAALLRERALAKGVSHVLFVSIDHAGSSNATPSGKDAKLVWLGGLQVSFLVLDLALGETVAGGVEQAVTSADFDARSGVLTRHPTERIEHELAHL
ncbi:hypothetical protein ACTHAM_002936 [Cellulomonas soli]|uniref:hypothetical protein n=1 Tax=Cellulomonas soli TaxID=931535 RepID=UPI003F877EA7